MECFVHLFNIICISILSRMTYEFFSCVSSSTIWLLWQLHLDNYWFDLDSICSYLKRLCWAWNETGCHWPPWWSGTQVFVEVGNCTSQYFSAQLYWVNLGVTFFTLIFLLWKHNLIWQRVIHMWCTDILVLWGSELDGFLWSWEVHESDGCYVSWDWKLMMMIWSLGQ